MEFLLVFYILSGIIKGFLLHFGISIPIDITVLSAILAMIVFFFEGGLISTAYNKLRFIPTSVMLLIIFWFWMIITLIYTSSTSYAYTKVLYFGTNIIPVFLILKKHNFQIKIFIKTYIIFVFVLALIYLPIASKFYTVWNQDEVDFIRMYLTLGENLGFTFLILALNKKEVFNSKIDLFLSLFAFGLLLIIGGRGPLLFVLLILTINYLISRKKKKIKLDLKKQIIISLLLLVLAIIVITYKDTIINILDNSMKKMTMLIEGFFSSNVKMDSSAMVRVEHFYNSINIIFRNLYTFFGGTGVGSFEFEVFGTDGNNHPHNQILEIWTELGLIGLIIYFVFFISILKSSSRHYKYISHLVILYALLNLLKSSSLTEIRIPIAFIVLSIHQTNKLLYNKD